MSTLNITKTRRTQPKRDGEDESWAESLVLVATQNGFSADREKYDGHSVHRVLEEVTEERYERELRV